MGEESERTKTLRKQLAESINQDEMDRHKSKTALSPEQFLEKWSAQLFCQPGTNRTPLKEGFKHDTYEMLISIIMRANFGHFPEDDQDGWFVLYDRSPSLISESFSNGGSQ